MRWGAPGPVFGTWEGINVGFPFSNCFSLRFPFLSPLSPNPRNPRHQRRISPPSPTAKSSFPAPPMKAARPLLRPVPPIRSPPASSFPRPSQPTPSARPSPSPISISMCTCASWSIKSPFAPKSPCAIAANLRSPTSRCRSHPRSHVGANSHRRSRHALHRRHAQLRR